MNFCVTSRLATSEASRTSAIYGVNDCYIWPDIQRVTFNARFMDTGTCITPIRQQ